MIKLLINLIKNYFFIFLGLFIFSIYIFFRFIRERIEKDIPFILSVAGFFILLEICFIYGYIVFRYIKPAEKSNEVITGLVELLFMPLDTFDSFIKNIPIIKIYYPKFIFWFAKKFEYIFKTPIFEIIFFFFPRIVLLSTFILDIFYFHKLHYIYKVLLVGIILFLRRYILYSIKKFKLEKLKELQVNIKSIITKYEYGIHPSEWPENKDPDDEEDDDEIPPTMSLPVEIFVKYYTESKVYNAFEPNQQLFIMTKEFYAKYEGAITMNGARMIIHKNSAVYINKELHSEQLKLEFKDLLNVYVFHEYYIKIIEETKYIKKYKIIIYAMYLISWLYILLVSIHTLNLFDLCIMLNKTWLEVESPFLGIKIYERY